MEELNRTLLKCSKIVMRFANKGDSKVIYFRNKVIFHLNSERIAENVDSEIVKSVYALQSPLWYIVTLLIPTIVIISMLSSSNSLSKAARLLSILFQKQLKFVMMQNM